MFPLSYSNIYSVRNRSFIVFILKIQTLGDFLEEKLEKQEKSTCTIDWFCHFVVTN